MIARDKKLHFICAFLITLIFGLIDINVGIILGIIASIGKELYDEYIYKGWDWKDLLADLLGLIIAILCLKSFGG